MVRSLTCRDLLLFGDVVIFSISAGSICKCLNSSAIIGGIFIFPSNSTGFII